MSFSVRAVGYGRLPIITDAGDELYRNHGINLGWLHELESCGLLKLDTFASYVLRSKEREIAIGYHDQLATITKPTLTAVEFPVGQVVLTNTGREIAAACGDQTQVAGFFTHIIDWWKHQGFEVLLSDETGTSD